MSARADRVLVTGATRGIGRALTELLLVRGARVAAVARDRDALDALAATAPGRVVPIAADLATSDGRRGIIPRAADALSGLDAVIACAGVARHAPLEAIDEALLAFHLDVNLAAPLAHAQELAAHVRATGAPASLTFLGSTLGIRPAVGTAAYAASKAALHNLTRSLAVELGPLGIRVNAVAPGVVDTDMTEDRDLRALRKLHPLGRIGRPEEIAEAILYLVDTDWVTGTVQVVDGGLLLG